MDKDKILKGFIGGFFFLAIMAFSAAVIGAVTQKGLPSAVALLGIGGVSSLSFIICSVEAAERRIMKAIAEKKT